MLRVSRRDLAILFTVTVLLADTGCGTAGSGSDAARAYRDTSSTTGLAAVQFRWNVLDVITGGPSGFKKTTMEVPAMKGAGLVFKHGVVSQDGKAVVGITDDSMSGVSTTGSETLWSMKIRAVKDLALSADGTHVAFSSTGSGLFLLSIADRDLNQIAPTGETPSWSPDGTRLAYVVDSGIVVLNLETGDSKRLTGGTRPRWLPDSKSLSYLTLLGTFEILDVASAVSKPFMDGRGVVSAVEWSRDGQWLLFTRESRTWWARNVASGQPGELVVRQVSDGSEFTIANISLKDNPPPYSWVVSPELAARQDQLR